MKGRGTRGGDRRLYLSIPDLVLSEGDHQPSTLRHHSDTDRHALKIEGRGEGKGRKWGRGRRYQTKGTGGDEERIGKKKEKRKRVKLR